MAIEVKLPEIGEGVDSGDVLEVLVQEGDQVKKGQPIVEFETEKASFTVESTHSGKVAAIHVKPGDSVAVGSAIVTLEGAEKEAAGGKAAAPAKEEKKPAPEKPTPEKPTPEKTQAPARPAGKTPPEEKAPPPEKEAVEAEEQVEAAPRREPAPARAAAETADRGAEELVPAGPAVRRFAREVGVDLSGVSGSGPGGRITREDVLHAVRSSNQRAQPQARAAAQKAPDTAAEAPEGDEQKDSWGPVRIVKMTRIRKTIAQQMHRSWSTVSRVTNFDDADITELEKIRQASKDDYASAGVKLTAMPFVIKAAAHSLRAHPEINASLDLEQEQIIYKEYVNIGVAVDTERGLVVPSLRGADRLSISEIARRLASIAESARKSKLSLDDFKGSTFTISNLGAVGGTYSTPIVNVPEVAILLVGRSRKMPMVVGEQILPRLMMPLSLSYDHRLVDGATAGRFLNEVISYLEAPSRLLLAP